MKLMEKYSVQVEKFIWACGKLASNLYVTSCGGNLAWKLEDDLVLITPTKMNKGDLLPEDLVFIDLKGRIFRRDSQIQWGNAHVSQILYHAERYCFRHSLPPTGSVCNGHFQEKNWLMRPFYPETVTEVGPVPVVPYAEPLTEKLANNFEPFLAKYDTFIMQNHGLVSMTRSGIKENNDECRTIGNERTIHLAGATGW